MMISLQRRPAWRMAWDWLRAMTPAHYLFLLFWVLKPFYLRPSGSMQFSDLVAMLAFGVWFLQKRALALDRRDFPLLGFVACTFVINGICTLLYRETGFAVSSFYYLYNLLVVLMFRDLMDNHRFLKYLMWASAANVVIVPATPTQVRASSTGTRSSASAIFSPATTRAAATWSAVGGSSCRHRSVRRTHPMSVE